MSLADRLAEAFAELLHHKVRTDWWGYASAEQLTAPRSSRAIPGHPPRPGYPACPDHSVKRDLFALLQCEDIGMGLTDAMAMTPAASVSGFTSATPTPATSAWARWATIRCRTWRSAVGMDVAQLQRFLAPNL